MQTKHLCVLIHSELRVRSGYHDVALFNDVVDDIESSQHR